jgi:hypothetical protein
MGTVFEVKKGTIYRVRPKVMNDTESDTGRPLLLQPAEELRLITSIIDRFQDDSPVSPKQIRGDILEMFGKQVSSSWTWRLVKHDRGVLQRATSCPE